MVKPVKLTKDALKSFETTQEEAIKLVRHYADQYESKKHYYELGASCVVSVNGTVNTIIGSAEYLDGMFVMADTINVDKVVGWFMENRDYECNRSTLAFYMAHYVKRKINELYRNINSGTTAYTMAMTGNTLGLKNYEKELKIRKNQDVKIIRKQ